jgi:hypothetical protein
MKKFGDGFKGASSENREFNNLKNYLCQGLALPHLYLWKSGFD